MKNLKRFSLVLLLALTVLSGCKAGEKEPQNPEPEVAATEPMGEEKPKAPLEEEPKEATAAPVSDYYSIFKMTGAEVFDYFSSREIEYNNLEGLTMSPQPGVTIYFMNEDGQPFGHNAGRLDEDDSGKPLFWDVYGEKYLEDEELRVYWIVLGKEGLEDFMGAPGPFTLEMLNEKMGQNKEAVEEPFFGDGVYTTDYTADDADLYALFEYEEGPQGEGPVLMLSSLRFARRDR